MLWKCRHTSNMSLLCLWFPIHWFINSVMVTINYLCLLTPFSTKLNGDQEALLNTFLASFFNKNALCIFKKIKGQITQPPFCLSFKWPVSEGWSIVSTRIACNYSTLISWQPSSDSLLMDSAPELRQTPVGPWIERAWSASFFYISVIISLLMLCLHSGSPQAPP